LILQTDAAVHVTRVVGWGVRFRSAPVSDDIRHTLASTRGREHLAPSWQTPGSDEFEASAPPATSRLHC
jgi:hypothetical protein